MSQSMLENVSRVINIGIVQRTPSNIIAMDVLKAMRNPTIEMITTVRPNKNMEHVKSYRKMIDAAINE